MKYTWCGKTIKILKIQPFSWFLNPLRDFTFRVITNKVMVLKSYLRVASGVFCMNVGFQFCTFKIVGGRVHSSMLFYKQPFSWFLNPSCDLPVEWLPPIITFWILCYGQHLWCKWWMYQKEVYFMQKYFSQQKYFMLYEFEPFSWFCL